MNRWQSLLHRWAMPGSAMACAVALAVILLVVVPSLYGGESAHAQGPMPGGGPGGSTPGMAGPPGMGGGSGPPMMMGPGGGGGAPMMGGGMGMGMGAPGTAARGGGGAPAAPAAAEKKVKPFEPYRDNPFLPLQGGRRGLPRWHRYGPRWSAVPIGLAVRLPRPSRPAPKPAPPPPAPLEKVLRVSSIAWAGGQPMATYETPDGKSGIVKPGEFIGDWQVVEILRDRIKVKNRKTGHEQEVFLRPKEKLPQVPAARGGRPAPGGALPSPGMGMPSMMPGMAPGQAGRGRLPVPGVPGAQGMGPMPPGMAPRPPGMGGGGRIKPGGLMRPGARRGRRPAGRE